MIEDNVIKMSDYTVIPKHESHMYGGHRYTLTYDTAAPNDEKWMWCVKFTRTYDYYGVSPNLQHANRAARRQIRDLNNRMNMGLM